MSSVRVFKRWGVVLSLLIACQAFSSSKDEDKESVRHKIPNWKFVNIYKDVTNLTHLDPKAQSDAKSDILGKLKASQGTDLTKIGEIFQKYSFEAVEKIAKSMTFSAKESGELSRMRREMINQAMAEAIKQVDPGKKLTIGMLDSGNKNSGIASDVDQTVFIMPKDLAKKLGITEAKIIEAFNKKFKSKFGVDPGRLGIESMNGADFFPDWRQRQNTGVVSDRVDRMMYGEEVDRVVGEKRKNPEAYRSEGQLKSQAEGRGYESLQQHHQRVSDLQTAKDKIEAYTKDKSLSPADRAKKIKTLTSQLLKKYQKNYPASSIDDIEQRFRKDSPWTEVSWEKGKPVTSQMQDPKNKVLKDMPETRAKRFAFDGAWDNWLMYENHPHNRRKYLLRSIAEGISLLRSRATGTPLTTLEYEKVYNSGDKAQLNKFLTDVYKGVDEAKIKRFRKSLDVAAKERLRHKGEKNPSTGKEYTIKEVWSEYWPRVSEAESKLYADMPKEAFEKMLHERAVRNWEADGREIMIENLVRTVSSPAHLLNGGMTDADLKKIQKKFPHASKAKLELAVRKQLYHGIHDLITIEHARALVEEARTGKKSTQSRHTSLVDRLFKALGGENSKMGKEVKAIALQAAQRRIATEPGARTFRHEFFDFMRTSLKEKFNDTKFRLAGTAEAFKEAKAKYQKGFYTPEYVADKVIRAMGDRWGSLKAHGHHLAGFEKVRTNMLVPVRGPIDIPIQKATYKWSGKKLFRNMATAGNIDSVIQVMYAYQTGGSEAAAWTAGYEIMMNFPPVAQLNAVKDLVVNKQPRGVIMMGSAMMVPALGQAYIMVSLGTTSVKLLGNYVLQPLKNDDADKMYQGFLDQSSGFKEIERSQRVSLLHFVPRRYVQKTVKAPEGTKDDKGNLVKTTQVIYFDTYSKQEARKYFTVFDNEYSEFVEKGLVGGDENWSKTIKDMGNEIQNPVAYFNSKRIGMYHYYRNPKAVFAKDWQKMMNALKKKQYSVDDPDAMPIIAEFFISRINDWVHAKGEFASFDENLIISKRFEDEALRYKIAARAAGDLVRSYQTITNLEESTGNQIDEFRKQEKNKELLALMQALHEAFGIDPELDMVHALHELHALKRLEEREPTEPRVHIRPRVVVNRGKDGQEGHGVDFLISVISSPDEGAEASKGVPTFYTDVNYVFNEISEEEVEVIAKVGVYRGKKKQGLIGYYDPKTKRVIKEPKEFKIGRVGVKKALPGTSDLMIGMGKKITDDSQSERNTIQHVEAYDPSKASSWGKTWGNEQVTYLSPQLWIRWKDAPLGGGFAYEYTVTGDNSKYTYSNDGVIIPGVRFPVQEGEPSRQNAFVIRLPWPRGYAGQFNVTGKLHAFKKYPGGSDWKKLTALATYDFEKTFSIQDDRGDTEVTLKLGVSKLGPETPPKPGDKTVRRAKAPKNAPAHMKNWVYEPTFLDWDDQKASPFRGRWGEDYIRGHKPQLWINWPDVPPSKRYYYEYEVTGGRPEYLKGTKKLTAIRSAEFFPPYERGKPRPLGNRFVIPFKYPVSHGGLFQIEGTLYAYEKGGRPEVLKQQTPLATLPFKKTFRIGFFDRSGHVKGTVWPSGIVVGKVRLNRIQKGKRVAKITGAGSTNYWMVHSVGLGGDFIFRGAKNLKTVTVEFQDFGEMARLALPVELKSRESKLNSSKCVSDRKKSLANLQKRNPYAYKDIIGTQKNIANCYVYKFSGNLTDNFEAWEKSMIEVFKTRQKWASVVTNRSWAGHKKKRLRVQVPGKKGRPNVAIQGTEHQGLIQEALQRQKQSLEDQVAHTYLRISHAAGRNGYYDKAKKWSQKFVENAKGKERFDSYLKSHYFQMARVTVRLAGDADEALRYEKLSNEFRMKSAKNPNYKPPPLRFEIGEDFKRL